MALDCVAGGWLGTFALNQNLILYSGWERYDALTCTVFLQVSLAGCLIVVEALLLLLGEVCLQYLLCLLVGDLRLCILEDAGEPAHKISYSEILDATAGEIITETQPEGVTYFIHKMIDINVLSRQNRHKGNKKGNTLSDSPFFLML